MPSPQFNLADIVSRLERDVARTIGAAHSALVHDTVAGIDPGDVSNPQAIVVDAVQQALHDEFVDTTWLACPRHHRHPLWYHDGEWWCEQDGIAIAALGELARSPLSR